MSAAHASVAHLRIPGFGASPVAEQAAIKRRVESALSAAAAGLPARERIVLDVPDGMAVIVLANERGALELANRWRRAASPEVQPAIGLSHGPVKVLGEGGAAATFVGGALSEAATAAELATAGRVMATRAFRDALLRTAPGIGRQLPPAGLLTDASHRSHHLFAADEESLRARRRRFLLAGGATAAALLALALPARWLLRMREPALVEFDIKPYGEISVDGVPKGRAPPLTTLELSPGRHVIEIRHPRYPATQLELEVAAGERVSLAHSFAAPASSPRSFKRRLQDFFR